MNRGLTRLAEQAPPVDTEPDLEAFAEILQAFEDGALTVRFGEKTYTRAWWLAFEAEVERSLRRHHIEVLQRHLIEERQRAEHFAAAGPDFALQAENHRASAARIADELADLEAGKPGPWMEGHRQRQEERRRLRAAAGLLDA